MTPSDPAEHVPPVRRSRRAVRHAGTVGHDDAPLVSTHPAYDEQSRPPAADPAAARGASRDDAQAIGSRSADDSDVGWGDRDAGSNDDRLQQDRPPHW